MVLKILCLLLSCRYVTERWGQTGSGSLQTKCLRPLSAFEVDSCVSPSLQPLTAFCLGAMLGSDIEKRVAVLWSRAWDRATAQAVAGFNLVSEGNSSAEDVSACCRGLKGPVLLSVTCGAVI